MYLSNIELKLLKCVCQELKRFVKATEALAVETEETLHLASPAVYELKTKLTRQREKYATVSNPDVIRLCSDLAKFTD